MEVLFLLITNYKDGLLEKQGFNFDSKFIISCNEGEKNKLTLSIKENPNYMKDFFKPEYHMQQSCAKISNISAIVGENGAGKTSVLDYIKDNVVYSEMNREEDTPFLFILREHANANEKCKHHIFYHPSFELSIIGDFDYESKSTSYREFQDIMKFTKVIFFSNIFD
ncbi:hypothetical protein C3581_24985, partial [Salmonella enterica]|nr:hypothetical protein [Salmonella enterica]